jgi:hypothetical protein
MKIIGWIEPNLHFIENIPHAVIIQPFVVRNLSHSINIIREILARHEEPMEDEAMT